ncbi:MAG TPA: AAA family ATPase, partial [Chloroflexota bacterium]|nr:AAA family ATPase [Chloroflexota bacterium]
GLGLKRRAAEAEAQLSESRVRDVTACLDRAVVEIDGLRRQILLELGSIDDDALDDGDLTVRSAEGTTYSSPLQSLPATERLRDRLDTLRSRLRVMTAADDAVKDYEELRNRFEFLRTQAEDLARSADTLRHAIDETQATMRSRFDVTFAQVSASFTRRFSELFGGGTAKLVLDQDGDGMGIDVIAQPPGKRSQSLATLSGGERALTAASLLFALIETSPPPFCLLDEVDAALDETNVARFCESLRNLSATTQFLIITHNRRTMEAASALWGLTLEGRTETRVLSTRLPSDSLAGSMLH